MKDFLRFLHEFFFCMRIINTGFCCLGPLLLLNIALTFHPSDTGSKWSSVPKGLNIPLRLLVVDQHRNYSTE
jgi:hypothetical protein